MAMVSKLGLYHHKNVAAVSRLKSPVALVVYAVSLRLCFLGWLSRVKLLTTVTMRE